MRRGGRGRGAPSGLTNSSGRVTWAVMAMAGDGTAEYLRTAPREAGGVDVLRRVVGLVPLEDHRVPDLDGGGPGGRRGPLDADAAAEAVVGGVLRDADERRHVQTVRGDLCDDVEGDGVPGGGDCHGEEEPSQRFLCIIAKTPRGRMSSST